MIMKKRQLIRRFVCLIVCFFLGLSGYPAYGSGGEEATQTISVGNDLPKFTLDAPGSEKEKQYLALINPKTFSLLEIPAKLIVLEIFSVFCPHCKMQADKLNKLYDLINQNSELSHDIKMIGIAAGADQTMTGKWKKNLKVPFPLFADPKFEIFKKFGQPGVPYTLVVTNSGKVMSIHSGTTKDVENFFRHIKKCHKEL